MDIIREAYVRMYPEKEFSYLTEINYNLRLSNFNANIRFDREKIIVNMNLQWKDIDDEIKLGLVQSLLGKLFNSKKTTPNIELYHSFVRNIPLLTPKTKADEQLLNSFRRVNENFFNQELDQTNLTWGTDSRRKLASYNFHDDTISVSTLFKECSPQILDYIMYHEMLHKFEKFTSKNGRNAYHTRKFRDAESKYPNQESIELEIKRIIRQKQPAKNPIRSASKWWWKVW